MKKLFSVAEAAETLGLGRTRLYEELASGRLESVTVGRRRLIPARFIEAFVDGLVVEQVLGEEGQISRNSSEKAETTDKAAATRIPRASQNSRTASTRGPNASRHPEAQRTSGGRSPSRR